MAKTDYYYEQFNKHKNDIRKNFGYIKVRNQQIKKHIVFSIPFHD